MLTQDQIEEWKHSEEYFRVKDEGFDPYDDAPIVDDAYKQDFSKKRRSISYIQGPLEEMAVECHQASYNNGWWHDPDTGKELPTTGFLGAHVIGCKIGLIGSEVSEIMEGHRKQKMDDKLPDYEAADVEIVDTIIRLFDLAGKRKTPLTEIYYKKMGFNDVRLDHQLDNRKAGGKLY